MCFPRYWTSFPRMKIGFQLMFLLRFHIIIHYVNLHCVYSIHYHRLISLQMIHKDEDFWPHDFFLDPFSRHDLTAMCNNYGCQFWCIFLFKSAWGNQKATLRQRCQSMAKGGQYFDNLWSKIAMMTGSSKLPRVSSMLPCHVTRSIYPLVIAMQNGNVQ